MGAERVIGIDFGTSTSVIRVKRYQDGKPSGDGARTDTKEVIFGNQTMVPTLVRKGDGGTYYGYDAMISKKRSILYQGFKTALESEDEEKKKEARTLTEEYLQYLAKVYREQSNGGHLGEPSDEERTLISYPVKWTKKTKRFMREAAAKAGFPNVEGMNEAEAAIHAVTLQSENYLREKGFLAEGRPCTILLIDMGAGTTDLVLCRYTPGPDQKNEILCTWPKEGKTLFGGQEMEEILSRYIRSKLPQEEADLVMKRLNPGSFKGWKETVVSPALARGETAEDFGALESIIDILELDVEDYGISRDALETAAAGYLKEFPELIQGCIREAGVRPEEIELVILTGGHSQWYFVKEMLKDNLPMIRKAPDRILPVSRPQETVALGLVYSPMSGKPEIRSHPIVSGEEKILIPSGKVKIDQPEPSKSRIRLTIEVRAEEFTKTVTQLYKEEAVKRNPLLYLNGAVVAANTAAELLYKSEARCKKAEDIWIEKAYSEAVGKVPYEIISEPDIHIVQRKAGQDFIFTADVTVRPEVKLGKYKGIEITKPNIIVRDEELWDFAITRFHMLEEYRKDVRERNEWYAMAFLAVEAILADAAVEIPEQMIADELTRLKEDCEEKLKKEGKSLEQFLLDSLMEESELFERMRPQAARRVKERLVLEQIAIEEDLAVTDSEIEKEEFLDSYGSSVRPEYVIRRDIRIDKAYDFIMSHVVIREKEDE